MKPVTTILFIENDAVALTMYQKRLQREGFHVETAEDGIAALKVLSEMTPDLVVLDLMLPKFSGRDVFDYMRADSQFRQVPVIIFSNASKSEWPKDTEASPTRGLPKSDANFAALTELIHQMLAGAAKAPVPADPFQRNGAAHAEPALVLRMSGSHDTATSVVEAPGESAAAPSSNEFLEYAVADMPILREHCLAFIKAPETDSGRSNLSSLRQRVQVLNSGAQKSGCARLALLASAWETLLTEIERSPAITSPSVLQTLAQAADCLRILLNNNGADSTEPLPKARVLSVDDDEICNEVALDALQRANIDTDCVLEANAALDLLQKNNYDLVLLDINMPGLTGFEVCEKLRALPHHEKTPVIFVTAHNNFENRKQSVLSGGGDLIAKPVVPLELALKVTIHLLKAPPKPASTPAAPAVDEIPAPATEPVANGEHVANGEMVANGEIDEALVWKEPAQTLSHDTEMFLQGVRNLNAAPELLAPTTETRTNDPAVETVEAAAPAPEIKADVKSVPEEVLQTAPATPATPPSDEPEMKKVEAKTEPEPKAVESATVPAQPAPQTEPALPASNGSSKNDTLMSKDPQFDILVTDVANIIFGENAPEINVRLVRMALDQVWQNRANLKSIESVAREIARIIFGDANATDLNVRLVKMALERSNSIALFKAA